MSWEAAGGRRAARLTNGRAKSEAIRGYCRQRHKSQIRIPEWHDPYRPLSTPTTLSMHWTDWTLGLTTPSTLGTTPSTLGTTPSTLGTTPSTPIGRDKAPMMVNVMARAMGNLFAGQ